MKVDVGIGGQVWGQRTSYGMVFLLREEGKLLEIQDFAKADANSEAILLFKTELQTRLMKRILKLERKEFKLVTGRFLMEIDEAQWNMMKCLDMLNSNRKRAKRKWLKMPLKELEKELALEVLIA
jgi:hypothetical protein